MTDYVELIKQSLQIAIAGRVNDRNIFQEVSTLLERSHDLQWVLENVMTNVIMDLADTGEEVLPSQFMDRLSGDVVEFFESLV